MEADTQAEVRPPPAELVRRDNGTFVDGQRLTDAEKATLPRLVWNASRCHYDATTGVPDGVSMPQRLFRLSGRAQAAAVFVDANKIPAAQRDALPPDRFIDVVQSRAAELIMRSNGTFVPSDALAAQDKNGRPRLGWNDVLSRYDVIDRGKPPLAEPPAELFSLGLRGPSARVFADAERIPTATRAILARHRFVSVANARDRRDPVAAEEAGSTGTGKRRRADFGVDDQAHKRSRSSPAADTSQGSTDPERLHRQAELLQERVIDLTIPKPRERFTDDDISPSRPSARVQVAVEILHARPKRHAYRVVGAILEMPPGEERMRCMEKLSPVVGRFPDKLRDAVLDWVESQASNKHASEAEQVQAHKFLTVARDNHTEAFQARHERAFSRLPPKIRRAVNKEFLDDMSAALGERRLHDEQANGRSSEQVLATVAHELDQLGDISSRMPRIRQSAYALRRVLEGLDDAHAAKRADPAEVPRQNNADRTPGGAPSHRTRDRGLVR